MAETADLERALVWADRSTDPLFKALAAEVVRLRAAAPPNPDVALKRVRFIGAFVDGVRWWEYRRTGATLWASDRNLAESEAEQRYDRPEEVAHG